MSGPELRSTTGVQVMHEVHQVMTKVSRNVGAEGAVALAEALPANATLRSFLKIL